MNRFEIRNFMKLFLVMLVVHTSSAATKSNPPDLVVLFIIDGLSVEAPEKIDMPHLNALIDQGVYYKAMHLILPGHPQNDPRYPWSCSMPNPMLMSGSPFIGMDGIKSNMIQHSFSSNETAFVVNARSYQDVSMGFGTYISKPSKPDALVIDLSTALLSENRTIEFARVHLQRAGIEGLKVSKKWTKDEPFHRNIWHEQSIYRKAITEADTQLGRFVDWLKQEGRWDTTILMICGDHGQANEGWHEPYSAPSNVTPLLLVGPGVKKGIKYNYCEIIDIAPTITYLKNKEKPTFSMGRILEEAFDGGGEAPHLAENIKQLNNVLIEANSLPADRKEQLAQKGFLTIDDLGVWHTTQAGGDFNAFVVQQKAILERVK